MLLSFDLFASKGGLILICLCLSSSTSPSCIYTLSLKFVLNFTFLRFLNSLISMSPSSFFLHPIIYYNFSHVYYTLLLLESIRCLSEKKPFNHDLEILKSCPSSCAEYDNDPLSTIPTRSVHYNLPSTITTPLTTTTCPFSKIARSRKHNDLTL